MVVVPVIDFPETVTFWRSPEERTDPVAASLISIDIEGLHGTGPKKSILALTIQGWLWSGGR